MKLSVIVPVYNMMADGKLQFCLESLVHQTISDYEIIAVDDKSTDDSLLLLDAYEKKYPDKFRVIVSEENRRQGGAKNIGLRHACGEWVGFVDSDDWITPDYYEKLLQKAVETGADIVGCNFNITDRFSFEVGEVARSNEPSQAGVMDEEGYRKAILMPGSMVTKIYRYSIFYDNGLWFPEYTFYEDNCTGVLTMLYCKKFAYIDEPLYYYYQNQSSTTHATTKSRCNDRLNTMNILMEECWKRGFLEEYPEELEYRFTEISYINTLFSYMLGMKFYQKRISYLRLLRREILDAFPDYRTNPYFEERTDAEVKKLTAMHCKSPFLFFWYYTALTTYRKIRYGKRKKENG